MNISCHWKAGRLEAAEKEVQREIGGCFLPRRGSTGSKVATTEGGSRDGAVRREERREMEVRRFCGRSHSPCGGLDDSAVEA